MKRTSESRTIRKEQFKKRETMNTNPISTEEILRRDQAEFRRYLHFRPSNQAEKWILERDGEDLSSAARKLEAAWRKTGVGERHCKRIPQGHDKWDEAFRTASERLNLGGITTLWGPKGSGKTQLAATLIRQILEHYALPDGIDSPEGVGFCTTEFEIHDAAIARFSQSGNSDGLPCLNSYRRPRLLVIDEIGANRTEYAQKLLEAIIDIRYRCCRNTILISNLMLDTLVQSLGASISDRIHECDGAIEMNWPSFRRGPT